MDFNLQLFITHFIGFAIAVWILKKYAWGPLLDLLEERRQKIQTEFSNIDAGHREVAKLTEEYEAKLREIDNERRKKITEAVAEGKKIAEEMKTAAQQEAKQIVAKAQDELVRDIAKAKVTLKDDMVRMTMTAASKIINEKLDDAKNRELIAGFIDGVEKV